MARCHAGMKAFLRTTKMLAFSFCERRNIELTRISCAVCVLNHGAEGFE